MDKKKVKLDTGETIYHGDYIKATLVYCEEDHDVVGRLCINSYEDYKDDDNYFICQDDHEGDGSAYDRFEYKYSWIVSIRDGKITSTDTKKLELLKKEDIFDNDVMPEDWVMDEIIPNDL